MKFGTEQKIFFHEIWINLVVVLFVVLVVRGVVGIDWCGPVPMERVTVREIDGSLLDTGHGHAYR